MPYTFEDVPLEVSAEPQIHDGITWVPLRSLAQALGANVDWDPDNRIAILYLGERIATFTIGNATASVDGQSVTLRAAPYLDNGDTWIPARFFQQALGFGLQVDNQRNLVQFSNPT
jgi:hypothetical protein